MKIIIRSLSRLWGFWGHYCILDAVCLANIIYLRCIEETVFKSNVLEPLQGQ